LCTVFKKNALCILGISLLSGEEVKKDGISSKNFSNDTTQKTLTTAPTFIERLKAYEAENSIDVSLPALG
jgi:hypothetical protein